MNKLISTLFVFITVLGYVKAQTYTAQMKLENLYWYQNIDNSPEWHYDLYADLYLDEELQTPGQYQYIWWKKIFSDNNPNPQWISDTTSSNQNGGDGEPAIHNRILRYAEIIGEGFNVVSDTIEIEYNKQRVQLNLSAQLQNGNNLPLSYFNLFTNPDWIEPNISGGYFAITLNELTPIRFEPYDLPQYSQKFNHWNTNDQIFNFYNYRAEENNELLQANTSLRKKNITIQINFLEYPSATILGFKDPWLVDTLISEDLGMRNSGDNAPFKYYNSVNFSDPAFADYKGVLLNQEIALNKPYYSIKIPSSIYLPQTGKTHNIYLQSWDVSGASLQQPDSLTTGVVFTSSSGATVTANLKGNLLSNTYAGFSTNSQRKIVRTDNGQLHMVYESIGSVWYTRSTNNGTTWLPETRVNPSGTNAKYPSIAQSADGLSIIYITYQIDSDVFPYIYEGIIITQYNGYTGTQNWVRTVYSLSSYSYDVKPVVAAQNNAIYVVFKPTSSSPLRAKLFLADGNSYSDFQLITSN